MFEQLQQQGELAGGQRNAGVAAPYAARGGVDPQRAVLDDGGGAPTGAARRGAQSRTQLVEVEGLDQEIVRPGVQPQYALGNVVARGDDDDGLLVAAAAKFLEQLHAALPREAQVEQDRGVVAGQRRGLAGHAITHPVNRMALLLQAGLYRLAQHRVVFDQQHAHGIPCRSIRQTAPDRPGRLCYDC